MPFKTSITIPINTPVTAPTKITWRLGYGVIRRWWILFRPGNPELAQIQIFHRLHQLIPQEPDTWLTADDFVFVIPDHYRLFDQPFELTVHGHNLDTAFEHTIVLHAQVLTPIDQPAAGLLQRLFRPVAPQTEA